MVIKLFAFFLKFTEILIKIFIIICFIISLIVSMYHLHLFIRTDLDINFMDIEHCVDMGRRWNYKERLCMWVGEEVKK
jgi:hypothetical protein